MAAIMDGVQAVLFTAKMDDSFWSYAAFYVVYKQKLLTHAAT